MEMNDGRGERKGVSASFSVPQQRRAPLTEATEISHLGRNRLRRMQKATYSFKEEEGNMKIRLGYWLAVNKHYKLLGVVAHLRLILWAILNRPIIHGVSFEGGFSLAPGNRNVLIMDNKLLT